MRQLVRLIVLIALAGTALGRPVVRAAADSTDTEGSTEELLERAREAAQAERFTGEVEVEWYDGRTQRQARVPIQSAGGVLRLGDGVAATGFQRMVRGSKGWLLLWNHEVVAAGPSPQAKYSISALPGPPVAGRATTMVEVRLRPGGRLRERLYLDRDNGLLLRREMLDARGEPYRSVGYLTLTRSQGDAPVTPRSRSLDPVPAGDLPAPYHAPRRLGEGYQLVGTYQKQGSAVHLFYSDGLHGLSVFEQRGRLRASLRGGRQLELMGNTVRAYSTAVGEVAVWEGAGIVYTVVSDAPWQDLAAAARVLPHSERSGRLRKVAEVVVSVFRWR